MIKLSFKKHPAETGLMAVGHSNRSVDIKVDKKIVGYIRAPAWDTPSNWKVYFSVNKPQPDDNPNCAWKWVSFKNAEFATEEIAREWVKNNIERVALTYKFHETGD